ncbi:hypothetical protein ACLESD_22765 [Pyxidicoccus sp. 3LFB2]
MKRSIIAVAVLLGVSLLGCGGPGSEPMAEPGAAPESGEETTVSQFGTCTALCAGNQSVSCSGTTCSMTDYEGVTCNGVFTPCPSACTGYPSCSAYANTVCSRVGETMQCCATWGLDALMCSRPSTSSAARWLYF